MQAADPSGVAIAKELVEVMDRAWTQATAKAVHFLNMA